MSRPLRIEYANAYYHVMNRGAGRKTIFNSEEEKKQFLLLLSVAHTQFNIQIHAYCLMTNHYHLLIKTPLPNLSRVMRHINGVYTQRYNRLNNTDGPLFRGRYKAILIDSDAYLIHLSKYIHLNPIEARIVDKLGFYKWSSYAAYIGQSPAPKWLFKNEIYEQLNKKSNHKEHYRVFVENIDNHDDIKQFYSKERIAPILGRDSFIENLSSFNQSIEIPRIDRLFNRPTIKKIIEHTANEFSVSIDSIILSKKGRIPENIPRKIAMYLAHKKYDYRLTELATSFQLKHYGGVAHAIYIMAKKIKSIPELLNRIEAIIKRLDP